MNRLFTCAVLSTMVSTAAAFNVRRGGSLLRRRLPLASSHCQGGGSISGGSSTIASTRLFFFSNFLGGGGAYGQKIPYDTLDHPGPELARLAQERKVPSSSPRDPNYSLATFAGGCFWGLELAYQRVSGVGFTAVGYTQGREEFPTYNEVCAGATGHTEAVMVYYDSKICSYETLLDTFFSRVDLTTPNGQGMDRGKQYRTGIYFHTAEQEKVTRTLVEQESQKYQRPVATEIKAATPFWPAEKYHQQYLEKGGRFNSPQDASKGATDEIRCYG